MKIKNIAFAITAIVVSTMLLTSCVLIPPDFTSDTQKSTATETTDDAKTVILPQADSGIYGQRASEIIDGAIKDATVILRAYPVADVSSGAPKQTPRRESLPASVRGMYDMLLDAVTSVDAYEWNSLAYGETAFSDFMEADEALRADYPEFRDTIIPMFRATSIARFIFSRGAPMIIQPMIKKKSQPAWRFLKLFQSA